MLRAIIPHVRADFAMVEEAVAAPRRRSARRGRGHAIGRHPRLAAIVRALDDLPEPPARLRGVNAIRIRRRTLEVIHLPAAEMRAADFPLLAFSIGCENERALLRADENSNAAHKISQ